MKKGLFEEVLLLPFGIICIILIAGLGGVIVTYTVVISNRDSQIASLYSQIARGARTVDEIVLNASVFLNMTVVLAGKLTGPLAYIPESMPPGGGAFELWGYDKTSENPTVFMWVSWKGSGVYSINHVKAVVVGVVRFEPAEPSCNRGGFFVEAQGVILL